MNLTTIIAEHHKEVKAIASGASELDEHPELFDKLYEYYVLSGEMPQGIAKARTGDPYSWITSKLYQL